MVSGERLISWGRAYLAIFGRQYQIDMESSAAFCPFALVLILHDCFIKCPWRGGHMCQVLDTSVGPKNHRPPLPFWPCPWVSPFPSPTKNRAFTHRSSLGSSHESGGNETQSAVARGVISGRSNPKFCSFSFNPLYFQRFSTFGAWFQPFSTWQIASQNDPGLGFGLGIFLFFLLWHLAIDVWTPRLWKAPSTARNLTSMEGGTKSSNLGTGNWTMVEGKISDRTMIYKFYNDP